MPHSWLVKYCLSLSFILNGLPLIFEIKLRCFMISQSVEEYGVLMGNAFADKLDGLMVAVCKHLTIWASNGRLEAVSF